MTEGNVVALTTPAVEARAYLFLSMRETPTFRNVVLDEFDRMLRGKSTPYFERYPELRTRVLQVLAHFSESAR